MPNPAQAPRGLGPTHFALGPDSVPTDGDNVRYRLVVNVLNFFIMSDNVVGEGPCALPLPGIENSGFPGQSLLRKQHKNNSGERTDTGVCLYLANNDYSMQLVGHDLHHI